MHKIIIFVVLFSTGVFANIPDWYPENPTEIEKQCIEQYPISAEAKAEIRNFKLIDDPNMKSLLLCVANGQNVYTPETDLDPERMAYSIYRSLHLECALELVRECLGNHKEHSVNGNHEDFMYLSLECIFDGAPGKCTHVE
ncbi:uncharacterized protein LOC133336934 [Musca vetustissima]|uniref:uncharacterized protein LOC133336934 n=1 Tax=Musca vetustissima TaxID=27455 RepID=UPI002AB732D5|nr:uncharacterized protein LOC133336934 [Musca vetustissima]